MCYYLDAMVRQPEYLGIQSAPDLYHRCKRSDCFINCLLSGDLSGLGLCGSIELSTKYSNRMVVTNVDGAMTAFSFNLFFVLYITGSSTPSAGINFVLRSISALPESDSFDKNSVKKNFLQLS